MEDDDDMDIASEGGDFEIDLDYEFDAPRFFDLSRPEFPSEALEAARWFETARSCPPSPLVAKMAAMLGAAHMEHTTTTVSLEEVKCTNSGGTHLDADTLPDISISSGSYEGSTLHSCMPQGGKGDRKSHVKRPFSKGSTLMKPTASQMAKQTRSLEVKNELRKSLITKSERSIGDPNDNAIREAKRQRLEGGHIFKVLGIKQHVDLLHKVSKKNGLVDSNSRARLKLTIPREPELETARRATAFRARRTRLKNTEDLQDGSRPTKFTFKARPLNRKILEAPSLPFPQKTTPSVPSFQEFHLKTHERAIKHSLAAAASSLIAENHIPDSSTQDGIAGFDKSLNEPSGSHQLQTSVEGGNMLPKCRGRALNKKIVSSKGDIGVFRSTKRETTKPKEFKFSTNRKWQPNPLTELFNKLSLAPEAWQPTAAEAKLQQSVQGSKENMINPVQ